MFSAVGESTKGDLSYRYRLPATMTAVVAAKDKKGAFRSEEARSRIAVAQLGSIASLPAKLAASSSTFKPAFYVNSGGLQEITIESKVPDAATVGSLSTSAVSIIDGLNTRDKAEKDAKTAEKAAADELNLLKREGDILEQKVRIQTANEKLME
jgi:hypothetical protein